MWKRLWAFVMTCIFAGLPFASRAVEGFKGVESQAVVIWSQGTRLQGRIWRPEEAAPGGEARPAILLAHGWGGLLEHLDVTYGPKFAAAGFVVLGFDYRGWGESEGILIPVEEIPEPDVKGEMQVRVREIREVVDPWSQLEDLRAALAFLASEPDVDPGRIGIWGTSYGGGHAMTLAASEPVAAAVVQVGSQGGDSPKELVAHARRRASQKARGELESRIPQGIDKAPGLSGTPDWARMVSYRPIDLADRVRIPVLFIDMSDEELFDSRKHGRAAYERVRKNAPARYELLKGSHYDVYGKHYGRASDLAVEWFQEHLKGDGS
jgi:dienelactone hydrolase